MSSICAVMWLRGCAASTAPGRNLALHPSECCLAVVSCAEEMTMWVVRPRPQCRAMLCLAVHGCVPCYAPGAFGGVGGAARASSSFDS